jgi:hypothetical protein
MSHPRFEAAAERFPVVRHFACDHLPTDLQQISRPLCELAVEMATILPSDPETSAGLRKLLEAKDCLVRSRLIQRDEKS